MDLYFDKFVSEITNNVTDEIRKYIEAAYQRGYNSRVLEEEIIFYKNPQIKIGVNRWFKYNYGAECESDMCWGNNAGGSILSYAQACKIPYMRLPTKEEFEKMCNSQNIVGKYNKALDGRIWNERLLIGELSFYHITTYDDKIIGLYPDCQENAYVHIWLGDSHDDKAMTAKFRLNSNSTEVLHGQHSFSVEQPEYIEVDKTCLLNAHFIFCKEDKVE